MARIPCNRSRAAPLYSIARERRMRIFQEEAARARVMDRAELRAELGYNVSLMRDRRRTASAWPKVGPIFTEGCCTRPSRQWAVPFCLPAEVKPSDNRSVGWVPRNDLTICRRVTFVMRPEICAAADSLTALFFQTVRTDNRSPNGPFRATSLSY